MKQLDMFAGVALDDFEQKRTFAAGNYVHLWESVIFGKRSFSVRWGQVIGNVDELVKYTSESRLEIAQGMYNAWCLLAEKAE